MIYLGQPYWHENEVIRRERANAAAKVTAAFIVQGRPVFSPIAQGVTAAEYLPEDMRNDHEVWMHFDLKMLANSDILAILPLPGWVNSRGLKEEYQYARLHQIPVRFVALGDQPQTPIYYNTVMAAPAYQFRLEDIKDFNWPTV